MDASVYVAKVTTVLRWKDDEAPVMYSKKHELLDNMRTRKGKPPLMSGGGRDLM